MSILTELSDNLQKGRAKAVDQLVAEAIGRNISAKEILEEGLLPGMDRVGALFKSGEIFVPEVMLAARAMNGAMSHLKPLLVGEGIESVGKVCIGTVKGDQHDIGKNLVKMMMEGRGLTVIDLGVNVAPEKFLETAVRENCRIVACSALLTTTMTRMKDVVDAFTAAGIRDRFKIMIGGAPVTEEFCKTIKADAYTPDAASAAEVAVSFCKNQ